MKKLILLITILIIFGGGYYFLSQSGEIIKTEIEQYGSEVTSSAITLEHAEVSLPGSSLTLINLVVGNPNGFATKNALILGKTVIQLKMDGNNPQNMHIESIVIDAPEVTYELVNGSSNLNALQHHIEQYSKNKTTTNNADGNNKQLALIIDDLRIRNARLNISDTSNVDENAMVLPEIKVQGIGKIDNAVTPEEAIIKTLTALTATITKEATKHQNQPPVGGGTTEETSESPVSAN